jgi:hypothetical protein
MGLVDAVALIQEPDNKSEEKVFRKSWLIEMQALG